MSSDVVMPQPVEQGFFKADNHKVKWYRFGKKGGIPVLVLHGGPGSGFNAENAVLYDLDRIDLVAFDQRGAGLSEPHGSMENNTTQKLIEDIETLRNNLKIEKWDVTGYSWGSTLALLYAQTHPERVKAITVSGLFLARHQDHDWTYEGAKMFFAPELDQLKKELNIQASGHDIVAHILDILKNGNQQEKIKTALSVSSYETYLVRLIPQKFTAADMTDIVIGKTQLRLSYYMHDFFIKENQICENADILKNIPITIAHGRFDMSCPINQLFAFKEVCPHANVIITHGGHTLGEEPMRSAYREALSRI